ncbi:MAG: TauD/TfdA family dioxygenase, partial [Spongiibacteraceae bacterium]
IYSDRINHGGILRALTVPAKGGQTGFMDKIKIYEALPSELKEKIDKLDVVYKMRIFIHKQKYATDKHVTLVKSQPQLDSMELREDRDFPSVVHPMVFTQNETGRKAMNLSPMFCEYIMGMDSKESDELIRELLSHIWREEFAYYHQWSANDLVLWDNWRIFHSAKGVDLGITRKMRRTTISGDYAKGRKLLPEETS